MWKVISSAVALSAVFIAIQAQDSCLVCTSSPAHPECINPDSTDFNSQCTGPSRNQSCFSRVDDNGNVVRGCLGQLDNSTAAECDTETCQICSNRGQNCNDQIFPTARLFCHVCSGGVNSTCAGAVNTTMSLCPIYQPDDRCYVARPNGNFERGCMSSSTTRCRGDEVCLICVGDGCNKNDYNSAINLHSSAKFISFAVLSVVLAIFNK